jgi:hypothetical protein
MRMRLASQRRDARVSARRRYKAQSSNRRDL